MMFGPSRFKIFASETPINKIMPPTHFIAYRFLWGITVKLIQDGTYFEGTTSNRIYLNEIFYLNRIYCQLPAEPNGETICWGHYSICVSFIDALIELFFWLNFDPQNLADMAFAERRNLCSVVFYVFRLRWTSQWPLTSAETFSST